MKKGKRVEKRRKEPDFKNNLRTDISQRMPTSFLLFMFFDYFLMAALAMLLYFAHQYGVAVGKSLQVAGFSSILEIAFGLGAVMFVLDVRPHLQVSLRKLSSFAREPALEDQVRETATKRLRVLKIGVVILGALSFCSAFGALYLLFQAGVDPSGYMMDSALLAVTLTAMCIVLPVYFLRFYFRVSRAVDHLKEIDSWLKRQAGSVDTPSQ